MSKKITPKKVIKKAPITKKKTSPKKVILKKKISKKAVSSKKIINKKSSSKKAPSVFGPDLQKRIDFGTTPKPTKTFDEIRKENPLIDKVANALNEILDPEIGIGIVDLGLIYGVVIETQPNGKKDAVIIMTLTSMGCPVGPMITQQVENTVPMLVPEIESAAAQIVWDPPWGPDRVKQDIRDMLFGF